MKENEIERISQRIKELEGAHLVSVGRASSLAWFLFAKNKTEYALHLQTGFRVVTDENIIFASADVFQPSEFLENSEEFDYDTFEWDIQGNSRYDERVDSFIDKYLNKLVVIGAFVNQYGDLTIEMNNGILIYSYLWAKECNINTAVKKLVPYKEITKEYGENAVKSTQDVDHIIDLQLGGKDIISNMSPLDKSVNRSLGSQIAYVIKELNVGTILKNFTIS